MRITDRELRQIIREVLVTVTPDEAHGATTGRHIKGSAVSSTAEKRFDANPALRQPSKTLRHRQTSRHLSSLFSILSPTMESINLSLR
jgi:hypothetical protein